MLDRGQCQNRTDVVAGQRLAEPRPEPIPIGEDSGYENKAIYIAVNRNGNACYCGETAPTRALNWGPPRSGSVSTSTAVSRSGRVCCTIG
ncbi:hypothetical protein GCM10010273_16880 [Streptomyces lavendulocolor]